MCAAALLAQGHNLVLHARNEKRAKDALQKNPKAEAVLTADLSDIEATKKLAEDANHSGVFDVVIHNAGVYLVDAKQLFAVNTLAPYILTSLLQKPTRIIYLSSGMHLQGHAKLDSFATNNNRINYGDTKLHVLMLSMAVARKWPQVYANAVDPGWVPTKMGGRSAPDNLQQGFATQVWLATNDDDNAKVSGKYFFHQQQRKHNTEADDTALQERFLSACEAITGVSFPA